MDIPVLVDSQGEHQRLADEMQATVVAEPPDGYYLCFEDNQWMVRNPLLGRHFSIRMNFDKEVARIKKQKISVKKDLLCRAVGYKGEDVYRVIDGTVGFAKDALHLVAQGVHVLGFERHPVVFTLLRSALENSSIKTEEFSIHFQDILMGISLKIDPIDCLYLDPMFEQVSQKSAPKKNMAFLRELDLQSGVFEKVIAKGQELQVPRIVVKRPLRGDFLYKKPNSVVEGKIVRYDIYLR